MNHYRFVVKPKVLSSCLLVSYNMGHFVTPDLKQESLLVKHL